MATADGAVLGATQIFGAAPRGRAFNVVLLAEGFTGDQQADFDAACAAFVDAFRATPPFDLLGDAINVFQVNVTSAEDGADDPDADRAARTYFDASFGRGALHRLLVCDAATALVVAGTHVAEFTLAVVVVNSTVYGGSGGAVATYSLAEGAADIAIHESGHTAFGLADEYALLAAGEQNHDRHPPGEPREPNVTTNTDRATLKWGGAVARETVLPTMRNPDCAGVDARPSPVPAGTVGLFEGAHYYHCGAYRPEYDCKMRTLAAPFCRVCRQAIVDRIGPFLPDAARAALESAALGSAGQ